MGCGASVGREAGADKINIEEYGSVLSREKSEFEASHLTQKLVHSHNLKSIDEVYDIKWSTSGLGEGVSGFVRECQHKVTKKWYAVKTIDTYRMNTDIVNKLFDLLIT